MTEAWSVAVMGIPKLRTDAPAWSWRVQGFGGSSWRRYIGTRDDSDRPVVVWRDVYGIWQVTEGNKSTPYESWVARQAVTE